MSRGCLPASPQPREREKFDWLSDREVGIYTVPMQYRIGNIKLVNDDIMSCSAPSKHCTKTVVYFMIKKYLNYLLIFRKSVDCIFFP